MVAILAGPSVHDLGSRLAWAQDLARAVGRDALTFRESAGLEALDVTAKGLQDFVTLVDRRAEMTIRDALAEAFPKDGFLGEEFGGSPSADGYWVVDPIDGTSNYIRGLRHWGVSIAYVAAGATLIGVIFDAVNDRVYSATQDCGAFRDGIPIQASQVRDATAALSIVGYSRRTSFEYYQATTRRLHELGVDYRRIGSAAIGLVRVADGIADLYYERHVNIWDVLAGALIAREAGAVVHLPPLTELLVGGGPVIASAPHLDNVFAFLHEDGSSGTHPIGR
jgi:myo-inositol-1(or 4)-monophosphatase